MATYFADFEGIQVIIVCVIGADIDKESVLLKSQMDMKVIKVNHEDHDLIFDEVSQQSPHVVVISELNGSIPADELCFYISRVNPKIKTIIISNKPINYERLKLSGFSCRGYMGAEQRHQVARVVRAVNDGEAWIPRKIVAEMLEAITIDDIPYQTNLKI